MNRRSALLDDVRALIDERAHSPFVAGETYVPASGKVVDGDDAANLVDASLDLWLTSGRFTVDFERNLASFMGLRKAATTVSGSAANLLAFSALTSPHFEQGSLQPGDEVITVAAGFPTTVNPIVQNGCVPVFVDIELATHNIDTNQLEKSLSDKSRAVMVAHTLGNPFNVDAVTDFCRAHNLVLIEDCCDALGSTYRDKHVGTFGIAATLSFYPAHHITMGEGGAVLTNAPSFHKIVESFRDWGRDCYCAPGKDNTCQKRFDQQLGELPHGYDHKYTYSHIGYNMKVTDMQAAIGLSQLAKAPAFIEKRRQNHTYLLQGCRDRGLDEWFVLPEATPNSDPSWFGFLLSIHEGQDLQRNDLVQALEHARVGTRLLFAGNITKQPAYRNVDFRVVDELPNTDHAMRNSFWVGCWPGLTLAHLDYILDTLDEITRRLVR